MKKLWAAVLTGLLGCSTVSLAADVIPASSLVPVPPQPAAAQTTSPTVSSYNSLPMLAAPALAEPIPVKKKTEFAVPADPKPATAPALKPGETKWTDVKSLPVQAPPVGTTDAKPLPRDTKPGDLPVAPAPGLTPVPTGTTYVRPPGSWTPVPKPCAVITSCTPCPVTTSCTPCPKPCPVVATCTPCPKPCATIVSVTPCPKPCAPAACSVPCAKPCTTCATCASGCGSFGGKLRDFFTYRPCHTPLGECGIDYKQPAVYTFFLDTPCRETWKPMACCDKPCGTCACKGTCTPGCGVTAPVPASTLAPLPESVPASLPAPVPAKPLPNR